MNTLLIESSEADCEMKRILFTLPVFLAVVSIIVACIPQTSPETTPTGSFSPLSDSRTEVSLTPTTIPSADTIRPIKSPEQAQQTATLPSIQESLAHGTVESIAVPTAIQQPPTSSPATLFYYSADGHLYRAPISGGSGERLTLQPLAGANDPDAIAGIVGYRPPRVSPDGRLLALNGNWGGAAVLDLSIGETIGSGRGQAMLAPSWSPDSRQLSYITQDDRLCLYDLDAGPDDCPFQRERLQDAQWSPLGSTVAVAVVDPIPEGDVKCCNGEVWLVDAFTGEATPIGAYATGFESVPGETIAWLADGLSVVIKKTADGRGALYTLADGSLTYFDEPVLSVAPDGRAVLHPSGMISFINDVDDVNVVKANFSLPDTEDCEGSLSLAYVWSPDGGQLAYAPACLTGDDAPQAERVLYVIETATGNLRWQQALPAAMYPVGWSPEGDQLLLQSSPGSMPDGWSIWRMTAGGEQPLEKVVDQALFLEVVPQWRE